MTRFTDLAERVGLSMAPYQARFVEYVLKDGDGTPIAVWHVRDRVRLWIGPVRPPRPPWKAAHARQYRRRR